MEFLNSKYTPWVIGAGVLIGGYILLSGSGSSSSSGSVGYDTAQLDIVALQAQLSADLEKTRLAAESSDTAAIAGAFSNLMSAKYATDLGMAQVSAGVGTARIAANTAKVIEDDQQRTQRLAVTQATKVAGIQADTAMTIANIQAITARKIAGMQAAIQQQGQTLGFIGDAVKGIAGVFGL